MFTEQKNNTLGLKKNIMLVNPLCGMFLLFILCILEYVPSEPSNCNDYFTLSQIVYIWIDNSALKKYTQGWKTSASFNKRFHHNYFSVVLNHRESVKRSRVVNYPHFIICVCVFRLIFYDTEISQGVVFPQIGKMITTAILRSRRVFKI